MYQAHYINPLIRSDRIEFTLVLEDDENVLPSYRIERSFPNTVTEEELNYVATEEILKIVAAQQLDTVNKPVESIIDLPANVELGE